MAVPVQVYELDAGLLQDAADLAGVVTEIANSSKSAASALGGSSSSSQEATKFEVRIRINENTAFRPGMSVSTEIESRYVTNALTVPYAAVTTRMPKMDSGKGTNTVSLATNTNSPSATNTVAADKKPKDAPKQIEVVFVTEGDHVKMVPVKIGITDGTHWEILSGLSEGQEFVSGSYKAVNKELEDGKKFTKNGGDKSAPEKK